MHMQSNNDEKKIDFFTHLQEKLPLNKAKLFLQRDFQVRLKIERER